MFHYELGDVIDYKIVDIHLSFAYQFELRQSDFGVKNYDSRIEKLKRISFTMPFDITEHAILIGYAILSQKMNLTGHVILTRHAILT